MMNTAAPTRRIRINQNLVFWGLTVCGLVALFFIYWNNKNSALHQYTQAIRKIRTEKNLYFATSPESPFGPTNHFTALRYFEPDISYKVSGSYEEKPDSVPYFMRMTKAGKGKFVKSGFVDFTVNGLSARLTVFIDPGLRTDRPEHLFIPFTDETNGKETYSGGRYLNVILGDDKEFEGIVDDEDCCCCRFETKQANESESNDSTGFSPSL
jgi:hypothetical protein